MNSSRLRCGSTFSSRKENVTPSFEMNVTPFEMNVTPFKENVTHSFEMNVTKKKNKKEKTPITPKEKNKIKTPLTRARAKANTA